MPIIQPGRGGGIHGRGVSPRCGQGGRGRALESLVGGNAGARGGQAGLGRSSPAPLVSGPKFFGSFTASGVTKDSSGAPLGDCTVDLYSESRTWLARTTSDGAGAYSFACVGVGSVFVTAFKAGAPDVTGTTLVFQPLAVP